jgi:ATP-dependent Clp protease ATP-binding subunit ClpA
MNLIKIETVIKELKNDLNDLYKTSRIDPFIIIHYSLKYPEFVNILKKYSLDVKIFHELLFEHIQKEVKIESEHGLNDHGHYSFNNQGLFQQNINNQLFVTSTYQEIYNRAIPLEIRNLNFQPPKSNEIQIFSNGKSEFEMKVSLLTFFEAFLIISKRNNSLVKIHEYLEQSNFNTREFLKDCDDGEILKEDQLETLCQNLNTLVSENKVSKVIGREKEIESVILTLTKHKKNNPVLIGKAGVGKTAIAEGLAEMIVNNKVPKQLSNAVVYHLEVAQLVAGTKFRGEFEERIMNLLKEFKKKEKKGEMPILFIDEIHSIVGSGNSNGLDLSNILKPALARGEIRTLGATTTDEWHQFITDNKALQRRFIPIVVKEPSYEETFDILKESRFSYEKKHGVKYTMESISRAIELSNEFIENLAQPDKSFDLIDIAGSYCAFNNKTEVLPEDIEFALHKTKNISLDAIQYSKKKNIIPIQERLKSYVFGQDDAINSVSKAVELNLAGISDPSKPIGSFLFIGPTGVGKTELAKSLANEINAHCERLDMSEYMDEMSANKLLGSAPGFVGYDAGSPLTKILQENPRTVLLFDEIEKAHPKILNLLLQAMDNSQVTDSKGNKISFKNVVLIMTSNAGAKELEKKSISLGGDNTASQSKSNEIVKDFFSPEFRGRLTEIISFKPMNESLMLKILNKELTLLNKRLNKQKINLDLTKKIKNFIIKESLSKNLGARPLKNFLNKEISSLISSEILYGKLKDLKGETSIKADLDKNNKFILIF